MKDITSELSHQVIVSLTTRSYFSNRAGINRVSSLSQPHQGRFAFALIIIESAVL